jgi:hypothetical protein
MGAHGIPEGRAALPAAGRVQDLSILRILPRSAPAFKRFLGLPRLTFPDPFDR